MRSVYTLEKKLIYDFTFKERSLISIAFISCPLSVTDKKNIKQTCSFTSFPHVQLSAIGDFSLLNLFFFFLLFTSSLLLLFKFVSFVVAVNIITNEP